MDILVLNKNNLTLSIPVPLLFASSTKLQEADSFSIDLEFLDFLFPLNFQHKMEDMERFGEAFQKGKCSNCFDFLPKHIDLFKNNAKKKFNFIFSSTSQQALHIKNDTAYFISRPHRECFVLTSMKYCIFFAKLMKTGQLCSSRFCGQAGVFKVNTGVRQQHVV